MGHPTIFLIEEDARDRVGGGRLPADLVLVNRAGESDRITYTEDGEQLERLLARLTSELDPDS